jgi:hypothetical protein
MPYYSLVTDAKTALHTWTVVNMAAAKFKPFVFPVSGFALSNIAKICRRSRIYFTTDLSVSQYVLVSSTHVGLATR